MHELAASKGFAMEFNGVNRIKSTYELKTDRYWSTTAHLAINNLNAQIGKVMKLTLLLLLVGIIQTKGNIYGQQITLDIKNQSLGMVCGAIEKQTPYVFFIASSVDQTKTITVKIQSASIEEVLRLILKDLPLDYAIKGKTITIIKRIQKYIQRHFLISRYLSMYVVA
ncbi:STN domain-containing protein [Paraflavitalea speifideaquila]|uniref:STN domain-containing protein n=1 Tax=Paraflavitalea speifideaquila TaxID=3076558 RepID=UPI0028F066A4|nr:STN domain-containing protein [Paraflavitalea speifideiaquila]